MTNSSIQDSGSNDVQLLPRDNPQPSAWGELAVDASLDVVIFSKDRGSQLDGLLRSMRAFVGVPHRVYVLYTASDSSFEQSYRILRFMHQQVRWVPEQGVFQGSLKRLLNDIYNGPGKFLMFLVDDMVFTREFTAEPLLPVLSGRPDILAISLRLGENITHCYTLDMPSPTPVFKDGYRWNWRAASGDWAYPMSLDGNIYRKREIIEAINGIEFDNPNILEAALVFNPIPGSEMLCEAGSCVINIAWNQVQGTYENRHGCVTAEYLNQQFLAGSAIDIRPHLELRNNSCHVEAEEFLIPDQRTRLVPDPLTQDHVSAPSQRIDLREIPVFVINRPEDVGRRIFMTEQLAALGIQPEFVAGITADPYWMGLTRAMLNVLSHRHAQVPFMVLEDDCQFTKAFKPVIEVPGAADAVYLGVSTFGIETPGKLSWGVYRATKWSQYDEHYLQIYNMLSSHAVLFLNPDHLQKVVDRLEQSTRLPDKYFPLDVFTAVLQFDHCVLTPIQPACRQLNLNGTEISLPGDLPHNEILPDPVDHWLPFDADSDFIGQTHFHNNERANRQEQTFEQAADTHCVISHKYRFIFFPMARNASSALQLEFCKPRYDSYLLPLKDINQEQVSEYFKFAILRDPVSRFTSIYQEVSMRQDMGDQSVIGKDLIQQQPGADNAEKFISALKDGWSDRFTRTQKSAIGALQMDFWGRVETLQEDLRAIYSLLKMGTAPRIRPLKSRAIRKSEFGYSKHLIKPYELSRQTIEDIHTVYQEDVDLLQKYRPRPGPYHVRMDTVSDLAAATASSSAELVQVRIQLKGGHHHQLPLAEDSPFLHQLYWARQDLGNLTKANRLLQLPIDGGHSSLAFAIGDLLEITINDESGPARNFAKNRSPAESANQAMESDDYAHCDPATNVSEGHLGGYIKASPTPSPSGLNIAHGDPETWHPALWEWMVKELGSGSVLDLGCGEAHAAAFFRDSGCEVLAIDGSVEAHGASQVPGCHVIHDFAAGPYTPEQQFDVVWCCEFVEHVEQQFIGNFLTAMSAAKKYIFMTHAKPGQMGWHHVNCQEQEYWVEKLQSMDFCLDEKLTETARIIAAEGHFSRNGLVFRRVE